MVMEDGGNVKAVQVIIDEVAVSDRAIFGFINISETASYFLWMKPQQIR
jgi:hypothetical protein